MSPEKTSTVQVAISDATADYDKLYTYAVPASLEGHIFVGSMVLVPFGVGARRPRVGVVLSLEPPEGPLPRGIKKLYAAAPPEARLTEEQLAIVAYLREATFCTWYEAVRAVLPQGAQYKPVQQEGGWVLQAGIRRHTEEVCALPDAPPEDAKKPTSKGQAVLDILAETGPLAKQELLDRCDVGPGVLKTLEKNGWVLTTLRDRSVELADFLLEDGGGENASSKSPSPEDFNINPLNEDQARVAAELLADMEAESPKPAMLYGVTGSGKTSVFLYLAAEALKRGRTALVLVPEIGLTPQMMTQMRTAFGSAVAVQHSGLSQTERLLQWRAIQRGEARVVVGTRSAVFAPLDNIGLIVVDEEQERSYQSESAPRYDAIEIARRRAQRHGALLLLASATPSVASYYHAKAGRYSLHTLTKRYGDLPLPEVEMVDMHDELMEGNPGFISRRLAALIRETLEAESQVILLLNRRGYHRVGICRSCNTVLKCPDCSVAMTYHRARGSRPRTAENDFMAGTASKAEAAPGAEATTNAETAPPASDEEVLALWKQLASTHTASNLSPAASPDLDTPDETGGAGSKLLCHYCGRTIAPAPDVCPECGGTVRYTGFGTQRLEEELAELFPTARVLRMDMDTTSKRGAHTGMLKAFGRGEYDILLGTQMVAKGLDFERVSLVGVIGIDSLLFAQGYRAYEQVFSLVTQVVGRSGRSGAQGRALIQSVDVDSPVLTLAAKQDYDAFYEQEIAFRKLTLYPPLCALCVVVFASQDENNAQAAGYAFADLLAKRAAAQPDIPLRLLGPAPMNVAQIAGTWRWRLTLKCRADAAFRGLLRDALEDWRKAGWPRRANIWFDFHSEG